MRRDDFQAQRTTEQRWLFWAFVLLSFTVTLVAPKSAWAALAVPMCSPYGESIVAPPPEAPPTGGEIRRITLRDPRVPSIDFAPSHERQPLPWQQPPPDPALVTLPYVVHVAPAIATFYPLCLETSQGPRGIRVEVFRPPCVD